MFLSKLRSDHFKNMLFFDLWMWILESNDKMCVEATSVMSAVVPR